MSIDMAKILAELDQDREDTRKFANAQHKLAMEAMKPPPWWDRYLGFATATMALASLVISVTCLVVVVLRL